MVQTKVFLDYGLPGFNEIVDVSKKHWGAYAALKKKYTTLIAADLVTSGCVPDRMYDVICINILWGETAKKRDPDNVMAGAKFILDAMVNAKLIPDDSRNHVLEINHNFTGAIQARRNAHVSWRAGWLDESE